MDFKQIIIDKCGDEYSKIRFSDACYVKATATMSMTVLFERFLKPDEKAAIEAAIKSCLPPYASLLKLTFKRSYVDSEVAESEILNFCEQYFPAFKFKLSGNFSVAVDTEVTVQFRLDTSTADIFKRQHFFVKLKQHLENKFLQQFVLQTDILNVTPNIEEIKRSFLDKKDKLADMYSIGSEHVINVSDLSYVLGKSVKEKAAYISEILFSRDDVTVCGTVSEIAQRTAKTGREYAQFTLTDFTGQVKCLYFARKPQQDEAEGDAEQEMPQQPNGDIAKIMQNIADGSTIVVRGSSKKDDNNGSVAIFIRSIALCKLPDKIKIEKDLKPVQEEYKIVFPKKILAAEQANLFGALSSPPSELNGKSIVVFDLETTGLDASCYSITEIGAVLIENGEITQSFSTFVNPEMPISLEITKITGIDDEMVKGAPKISEVIGDFHKFCYGKMLVAHNMDFDIKFVDRFAKENKYEFNCAKEDTLIIARQKIKDVKNYKLDTLTEYFGIELENHHRALDDALATAKLYIELKRL